VPAVVVFTTVTLGVTIQHADKLHLDGGLALGTRVVAWVWIVVCATVAVLLAVGLVGQWRRSTTVAPPGRLPLSARAVLSVIAAFFVGIGLVLLMAPGRIDLACPWPFTSVTSALIGAWLLGLGTAAAHARQLNDRVSIRPHALTGVAFGALQAVSLVRYGGELDWGKPSSIICVTILVVLSSVSLWALTGSSRPPKPRRRVQAWEQAGPERVEPERVGL
jgi:hypothetical protein